MADILEYVTVAAVLSSLIPACYYDYKSRKVPIWIWKPAAYIGIPVSMIYFILKIMSGEIFLGSIYILVGSALILMIITVIAGYVNLFGFADSIAMSIIALTAFHFQDPVNMNHPSFVFPFINNLILCLVFVPVLILIRNIYMGHHKGISKRNILLLLFATKVDGYELEKYHGIVLEDIKEVDGEIKRRFVGVPMRMNAKSEVYTIKSIMRDPSKFAAYSKESGLWVMYLIPMIVPITVAYILTTFPWILFY